jgi:hypothetical protein
MPDTEGFRVNRLRRRRRGRVERWQTWLLYGMAALVGFAAVLGAWYVAGGLGDDEAEPKPQGYIALLTFKGEGGGSPAAAALVIKDAATKEYSVYVVPRELLLEGPHGEYVMAGDAMTGGTLRQDMQRVIGTKIDGEFALPAESLVRLAGASKLRLDLEKPVALKLGGVKRGYSGETTVPAADVPDLMAASGPSGYDASRMQEAVWTAALDTASLRPLQELRQSARRIARSSSDTGRVDLVDALVGLSSGHALVERVPSSSRVAEGQFAFLPDTSAITAQITRHAPGYRSRFTVILRNGNGRVGVAEAAALRLAGLDVNLPSPTNADSFDYRQTQILAGKDALRVAQDIRAILGRGVVLDGAQLPPTTVVVILGSDVKAADLEPKDEQ